MTTQERFEERLLAELRQLVPERPAPQRSSAGWRRRLVLTGGLAAALAVAAGVGVPLLTSGGSAAYAVTKNDDGSVTVQVGSLADAAGLQQKLRDAGVPAVVQYIPAGKGCKEQTFTPATPEAPTGGEISVRSQAGADSEVTFTIDRSMVQTGLTLVLQTATGVDGVAPGAAGSIDGASIAVAWAQGEVKPCELVDASQAAQQPVPTPPPLRRPSP